MEDKANAILVGGVGLGKTHLGIALGYAACLAGHHVLHHAETVIEGKSYRMKDRCPATIIPPVDDN